MRDHIFRLCLEEPEKGSLVLKALVSQEDESLKSLIKEIKELLPQEDKSFNPIFHHLIPRTQNTALRSLADIKIQKRENSEQAPLSKRPLKVIKMALENIRNQVGGIGAVLKASAAAHNKLGLEKVRGIHPFYTHDKMRFDAKFKGIITHQFHNQMVKSSVYKDKATGEYLIQPDPRFNKIFDVAKDKELYASFEFSPSYDRNLYMASAAALFVSTYSGKKGDKSVDVIQADAWHVGGPVIALMANSIDYLREEAGLKSIKKVYLTHMLVWDPVEQGEMSSTGFSMIGGKINSQQISYGKEGLIHSDKKVFVSNPTFLVT